MKAMVSLTATYSSYHVVCLFAAGPEDPYQSGGETVSKDLRKGRGQKINGKSDNIEPCT